MDFFSDFVKDFVNGQFRNSEWGIQNHGSPDLTYYWGEIEQNSENLKKAFWAQNIVITPLMGLFELNQRVMNRVSKINEFQVVPLEDSL